MASFKVYKETPAAVLPTRGSAGAAGYDLASVEHKVVPARGRALLSTGLRIQVPEDCYARVAPRSGLTLKKGIDVGAGVIDSDYRGTVGVILFNHTDDDFEVNVGDRIAQLIVERIYTPEWEEVVDGDDHLEKTERGAGGFGSTGVHAA